MNNGVPFHGEVDSSLDTAELFTLYKAGGATSFVLGATDQIVITDLVMMASSLATITAFEDVDAGGTVTAGEVIAKHIAATAASLWCAVRFATVPHYCKIGVTPSLLCSGAVAHNAIIRGTVWRT